MIVVCGHIHLLDLRDAQFGMKGVDGCLHQCHRALQGGLMFDSSTNLAVVYAKSPFSFMS